MKMKVIILIFIALGFNGLALQAGDHFPVSKVRKTPKSLYHIKANISLLEKDHLRGILRDFVSCCRPNRMVGSVGHDKVAKHLLKMIRSLDPDTDNGIYIDSFEPDVKSAKKVYENDFKNKIEGHYKEDSPEYKKWSGFTNSMKKALDDRSQIKGKNVIWEKKGTISPDEIIVIGAHYDTIAHDKESLKILENSQMPGADDNGSGVAIALAMIQILSHMDLPKTVRIVFFDWEELGFLGSRAFVKKYKNEFKNKKFLGYINLEMLGHDSKVDDKQKKYGNMKAYIRRVDVEGHAKDRILAERLISVGDKIQPSVNFELVSNSFNSSDHISFWDSNLTSVTFTQNWEDDFNHRRYHSKDDFVETLNFRTLYRSYQFIASALTALLFDMTP